MGKMASQTPIPGILWVNSNNTIPRNPSREGSFDFWPVDNDEHIPGAVSRSGVRSASRYEHVRDGSTPARKLEFLSVYQLPDLSRFMGSEAFMTLEGLGVVMGRGANLERDSALVKNAEFDMRVYELVQVDEKKGKGDGGPGSDPPPTLLLFAAMSHISDSELDDWYRGEHVQEISKCSGYRRTRRYKAISRTVLSPSERTSNVAAPTWLSLHEFDGEALPWEELAATDETEWAKKIIPGIREIDYGCFKLTRTLGKKMGRGKANL